MKFAPAFSMLIIGCLYSSTNIYADCDIDQMNFTVSGPRTFVLTALMSDNLKTFLLAQGLHTKLEEKFPSDTTTVCEVIVQTFISVFGFSSPIAKLSVIRITGQTWEEALEADSVQVAYVDPPSVFGNAEYGGCNGNYGQFLNTWYELQNSAHTDFFEVQRKSGSYWSPYFMGNSSCVFFTSSAAVTYFRVQGTNFIGPSPWVYYTAYHSCYGGGGGPVQ